MVLIMWHWRRIEVPVVHFLSPMNSSGELVVRQQYFIVYFLYFLTYSRNRPILVQVTLRCERNTFSLWNRCGGKEAKSLFSPVCTNLDSVSASEYSAPHSDAALAN